MTTTDDKRKNHVLALVKEWLHLGLPFDKLIHETDKYLPSQAEVDAALEQINGE